MSVARPIWPTKQAMTDASQKNAPPTLCKCHKVFKCLQAQVGSGCVF